MTMLIEVTDRQSCRASLALSLAGLIVKQKDATYVTTAGAGDKAFGIALKTTRDPTVIGADVYLAGERVPVAFNGIMDLNLIDGNSKVVIGDILQTGAGGCVDKFSVTYVVPDSWTRQLSMTRKIVGTALEAVASSTGGTVKTLVHLHVP